MPGTMVSSSRAFTSVNSASNSVRKALLLPHLKEQKLRLERAGKTSGSYTNHHWQWRCFPPMPQ